MPETFVTRRCSICKVEKPITEFGAASKECLGKRYQCKKCTCKKAMEYHWKNREAILQRNRSVEKRNRKILWEREYRDSGRRKVPLIRIRKPYKRDRDKVLAKKAVWNAVKSGKIIRPINCSNCGNQNKIQAHHHLGYAVKDRLNVQWLCHKCHMFIHRKVLPVLSEDSPLKV